MIISEKNEGNVIVNYFFEKINRKYFELISSKFNDDINNDKYNEDIIYKIINIMETDNILIMKDFDKSIYDIFTKKFNYIENKRYLEINFNSKKIVAEVHDNFHLIIQNNNENSELLQENLEIEKIYFKMFLDKKDINIVDMILKYLNDISNNNSKHLLINCQRDDIEGLIFKIKNDMIISNNTNKNHWIFKDNQEYEINIIKYIFKKIIPLFCHYIFISLI